MSEVFDIFLLEAVLNGLLLGGLLALLSLGLNLVFGVIDVVWICYAELIMCGMYAVYYLHVQYHWPLVLAMLAAIGIVALLGWILHQFVIRPVLKAEPINQLLVTGGVLFFLQAAATLAFGIEFKNLGVSLPLGAGRRDVVLFVAPDRFRRRAGRRAGALVLLIENLFRHRDPRHQPGPGGDAADGRRSGAHLPITSAIGGALAGLAACLLVLQYDIHPAIGLSFGPITFLICVLGGLGNMVGGFVAAFIFAQFIAVGGFFFALEWGYVIAFVFFIAVMFWRPRGLFG